MGYYTRIANIEDIPFITQIYNEGIEDRIATLEIDAKTVKEMETWLTNRSEKHKVIVITDHNAKIYGWASLNIFNGRCCYSGVADFSIYIQRDMRGKGLGKLLLNALEKTAKEEGFHKLVLSAFDSNKAGKKLYKSQNFREVGIYMKQGLLDGQWVDITIMEKLLD